MELPHAVPRMKTWKIDSVTDVQALWHEVREVRRRTEGRTPKEYERHYLGLHLLALANERRLSYPLIIEEGKSPDFLLEWSTGITTGLEVTRATDEKIQAWMTFVERAHPEGRARLASSPCGYLDGQMEEEWCGRVRETIEKKSSNYLGSNRLHFTICSFLTIPPPDPAITERFWPL